MQIYSVLRRTMAAAVAALISLVAAGCATNVATSPPANATAGGESYVGAYKDGLRSGQGTYSWADGRRYVGAFRDGLPNGSGVYTLANGEKYVGEFQDNRRTQGTYSWPDGRQYVGPFRDDRPDGAGTYTWPDGKKYVGDFRAGSAEGQGVYTWPDGRRYVGALRADLPNGRGTLTLGDGRQFAGEFRDGEFVGTTPVAATATPTASADIHFRSPEACRHHSSRRHHRCGDLSHGQRLDQEIDDLPHSIVESGLSRSAERARQPVRPGRPALARHELSRPFFIVVGRQWTQRFGTEVNTSAACGLQRKIAMK